MRAPRPGQPLAWCQAAAPALRRALERHGPLAESTWSALLPLCSPRNVPKGRHYVQLGACPSSFAFLHAGLMRSYVVDDSGAEYTKNFFAAGSMAASMVALLTGTPSRFGLQALEDCSLLCIDFGGYRELLSKCPDLLLLHCRYLEEHWVVASESREVALVQRTAGQRYDELLAAYPGLERRVPLRHVASHLGITPTQLSRIRRTRSRT